MDYKRVPRLLCMLIGLSLFVQNVSAGAGRSKEAKRTAGSGGGSSSSSSSSAASFSVRREIILHLNTSQVDGNIEVCNKIQGITRYFIKESVNGIITAIRVDDKSLSLTDTSRSVTQVLCASNFDNKFTVQFSDNTSKEYIVEHDGINETGKSGTKIGSSTSRRYSPTSKSVGSGKPSTTQIDEGGDSQTGNTARSDGNSSNERRKSVQSGSSQKQGGVPVRKSKKNASDASSEVNYGSQNGSSNKADVDPVKGEPDKDLDDDGDVQGQHGGDAVKHQVKTGTSKLVGEAGGSAATKSSSTDNRTQTPKITLSSETTDRSSTGPKLRQGFSGSGKVSKGGARGGGITLSITGENPNFDEVKVEGNSCYKAKVGYYVASIEIKDKVKPLVGFYATVVCVIKEGPNYSILLKAYEDHQWKDMYLTRVGDDGDILNNISVKQKFARLPLQSVLQGYNGEVPASVRSINVQDKTQDDKENKPLKQQEDKCTKKDVPETVEKDKQEKKQEVRFKEGSLAIPKGMQMIQMRTIDVGGGKHHIVSYRGRNVVKHKKFLEEGESSEYKRVPYSLSNDYSLVGSLSCFGLRESAKVTFLNTLQIESSAILYQFPIRKYGNIILVNIPSKRVDTIVLLSSHEVLLKAGEKHRLVIVGGNDGVTVQITSQRNGAVKKINIRTGVEGTDNDDVAFA